MSMFSESLRAFLKPVTPFLDDPDVSEILINGPREVWVERRGKLYRTDVTFTEEGLLAAARLGLGHRRNSSSRLVCSIGRAPACRCFPRACGHS